MTLGELPTLEIEGPADYDRLKDRIRVLVATRVPPARTLVVAKGDDELLALHDRRGEHFPQDELGRFPSSHPADSGEAIAELERLAGEGAQHLLVPATSFWWFQHYAELTRRLTSHAELVACEPDACAVFDLRPGS